MIFLVDLVTPGFIGLGNLPDYEPGEYLRSLRDIEALDFDEMIGGHGPARAPKGAITERRRWLGGDHYGLADITAAAHLSCLDYLGDVPWAAHPLAKDWYARVKSRPAFRPLLADRLPGMAPAAHYDNLDF